MTRQKGKFISGAVLSLLLIGLSAAAQAQVIVTNRTSLGANDSVGWGQLGPVFSNPSNPSSFTSVGGMTGSVSLSNPNDDFVRRDQGLSGGWGGNFSPGDQLLWTNLTPDTMTITLDSPVYGIGANFQQNFYGDFTAQLEAFDSNGNSLGAFTENGTSNGNGDGSAIFLGVEDNTANIKSITYSDSGLPNDGFAINELGIKSSSEPVPEPGSLAMLFGAGLPALGFSLRRRFRLA